MQAAVRVDLGKLAGRGRLAAITPGRLVHVLDELSNRRFLCDTGASYSVFPFRSPEPPSGPSLTGPDGQRILCWGERELALSFHGVSFTWIFLLADVQFPILGIDFLRHYHLVVDAAGGQLVDVRSLQAFPAASLVSRRDGGRGFFSCIGGTPPPFHQLLVDYQDVLNPSGRLPPTTHGVEHHLPMTGRPVTARFRRLDPVMHAAAKAAFEDMERQGIVRRSSSCWASPLHMVKKTDGTWRPCGDFRWLNLITEPDKYPLPRMDDLSASLSGCKFFSKLDLKQGYHQIPMRAEDIKKTAIITPFGLFEYTRMPFGLRNSGQTFQRLMDRVLAGLEGVFCYLDDILVASPDPDSHRRHLRQLFDRLREYGLVLNANKCVFGQSAVEFLGHSVTGDGAAPLEDKTAAIRAFPRPTTVKELQGFLGTVNFYRRFIPGAAKILAPLTNALKGGGKGSIAIGWSPAMEAAFLAAKASLVSAATLAHPSPSAELGLMVDASSIWAAFCKQVGIKHIMTTAYHPQSNGMVERVHRQLKAALRSRNCGADWAEHLPWVLMGIRAAPKDDTGVSSAELVYGCGMVLPGELQVPSPPIIDAALTPPPLPPPHDTRLGRKQRHRRSGEKQPPVALQQAAYVYVRRGYCGKPLAPVYSGPYEVVERSPKYFTLRVGGAVQSFSVDRLKPHTGRLPVTPASPPKRGRPAAATSATALSPDA